MTLSRLPSRALLLSPLLHRLQICSIRAITLTTPNFGKPMPPRPSVNEEEIEESFLKGSGPGGQKSDTNKKPKQNKTSSAVQLKHLPTGIVVKSQATRSRSQNRKIARKILAEKLEFMEHGAESRVGALAERDRKKKASKTKKAKRKYAKLGADKGASDSEDVAESGEDEDHVEDGEGELVDEQGPKPGKSESGSTSAIEGETATDTSSEVKALNDSKPPNSGKNTNY
ncbi:hypothetical protein L873DRAFT_1831997 [Choiromyces venosus 120613-1]|uniref:Prokaryotic-type class I peptide chain release factors domain-containing protein n=1 Tax=Choiromyces venosus 120613-1 TaxID=1336337 RepID=A0A3N4ITW1_9PEZI|nr:hypothetical protein L873DRAFT_1831997 [Choiromyces venosus 120613-1]